MWGDAGALDERLGFRREAGKLIEPDLHQSYFDGGTGHMELGQAPIDAGVNRAGAVPLQSVWPSPRIAVLLDVPLGHPFGPRARRCHADDLRLGCRAADASPTITRPGTAANARAAAGGGASRPAPPAHRSEAPRTVKASVVRLEG